MSRKRLFTTVDKWPTESHVPWPVYVYAEAPAMEVYLTVEKTPLHSLHNATVMHDECNAATALDTTVSRTDNQFTKLLEGSTVQQWLTPPDGYWGVRRVCDPQGYWKGG